MEEFKIWGICRDLYSSLSLLALQVVSSQEQPAKRVEMQAEVQQAYLYYLCPGKTMGFVYPGEILLS
jgi:hypothetical protein